MDAKILAAVTVTAAILSILGYFFVRWIRTKKSVAKRLGPLEAILPESCYLEVGGVKLHYIQAGSGPDIVLLHGIGASVFIWRYLFPLLQVRYRVTALDLAGFGKSAKAPDRDYGLDAQTELVAQALSLLKLDSPLVVGSSMGGAITLWLAKTFPERFPKVAVLSPATDSSIIPTQVRYMAAAAPFLKRALNKRTMKLILARVLARRELITDEVVDAYLAPFLDEEGHAVRAFWSATALLSDRRLPRELSEIKSTVLIVYGERDLMVSKRSIRKLMKIIPDPLLVSHAEGGHHIMEDEPAWVVSALEDFIATKRTYP